LSEVDRLSNSGLYPALPIADKNRDRESSGGKAADPRGNQPGRNTGGKPPADAPRPPKSGIDEYA
jgi:hypothetical protein